MSLFYRGKVPYRSEALLVSRRRRPHLLYRRRCCSRPRQLNLPSTTKPSSAPPHADHYCAMPGSIPREFRFPSRFHEHWGFVSRNTSTGFYFSPCNFHRHAPFPVPVRGPRQCFVPGNFCRSITFPAHVPRQCFLPDNNSTAMQNSRRCAPGICKDTVNFHGKVVVQ